MSKWPAPSGAGHFRFRQPRIFWARTINDTEKTGATIDNLPGDFIN